MAAVTRISIAPVKGLGLAHPDAVLLERTGVTADRRFHLVDEEGRLFNLLRDGRFVRVEAETDAAGERLALRFPDGTAVDGPVLLGAPLTTDLHGRAVEGRLVEGPWSEALSAYGGRAVRLVRSETPGAALDRSRGAASLVSEASLERLAAEAGAAVDGRRFRMLFQLTGCGPHEEDGWVGREVAVGDAVVRVRGLVGRCAITTQDPESGTPDLDTLRLLRDYRGRTDEGLPFGVYAEVVAPGRVRVGDRAEPL